MKVEKQKSNEKDRYLYEIESLHYNLSKKDNALKHLREENHSYKKFNENLKKEIDRLKEQLNNRENHIQDLKEKIGQLQIDNDVY